MDGSKRDRFLAREKLSETPQRLQFSLKFLLGALLVVAVLITAIVSVVDAVTPLITALAISVAFLTLNVLAKVCPTSPTVVGTNFSRTQRSIEICILAFCGSLVGQKIWESYFTHEFFSVGYVYSPSPIVVALPMFFICYGRKLTQKAIHFMRKL